MRGHGWAVPTFRISRATGLVPRGAARAALVSPSLALILLAACTPAAPASPKPAPAAAAPAAPAATAPPSAQAAAPAATTAAPAATTAPAPTTLKIGMLRSGSELSIMVAMARGYFKQQGVDLQILDFTTGVQMIPPLATGELDIGSGGITVALFQAIARGIPLKIVADQGVNSAQSKSTGWVIRKELMDSGRIRSEADFHGLRVALGGNGTIVDPELDELLRRGGLTREDIETQIIPYPDQLAAFANSATDLAYSFEPTRLRMLEAGVATMWKYSGEVIENHESTVIMYGPSMETKRDAGRGFTVAYLKGIRDVHREVHEVGATSDVMLDYLVQETAIKDRELWRRMYLQWTNPDGYNYPTSIERDVKWFVDNGFLERSVPLADVLDQSYVDYAIQQLGKYSRP